MDAGSSGARPEEFRGHPLMETGSSGMMRSMSAPVPKLESGASKGLYEVTSGVVIMHSSPSVQSPGLGMLRAGAKFYATPYQVGRYTWCLLQTEGVMPPVFSQRHVEQLADPKLMLPRLPPKQKFESVKAPVADMRSVRLYTQSAAHPLFPASTLGYAEEVWVKFDEQCIVRVRKAAPKFSQIAKPTASLKRRRAPVDRQVHDLSLEASALQSLHGESRSTMFEASSRNSQLDKSKAEWSQQGMGAWVNFRLYGVSHSPPNFNCGRWRQLG